MILGAKTSIIPELLSSGALAQELSTIKLVVGALIGPGELEYSVLGPLEHWCLVASF